VPVREHAGLPGFAMRKQLYLPALRSLTTNACSSSLIEWPGVQSDLGVQAHGLSVSRARIDFMRPRGAGTALRHRNDGAIAAHQLTPTCQ